jgi:4-amino-4-deoxy-L-arabinose transferase-like glycosyltransferase
MSETPVSYPVVLNSRIINLMAVALLAILALLLFTSVRQESQTFDESTHLFAGFEYWKHGDFGRNPEHPPLVKLLAALPLLSRGLREPPAFPFPYFKAQDYVNGVQLLYSADADALLLRGRLVVALFSLTLGLLVFLSAKELFGPLAAILAVFLYVFEPNLLANGALITTDMGVACLCFASVYTFYRYCRRPSAVRLLLCAFLAALTIVAKHSGILILPMLVLLALADLFLPPAGSGAAARDRQAHLRQLGIALIAIFAVSYLVLWAFYGFRYVARPGQLQIIPPLSAYSAMLTHPLQQHFIDFLARYHLLPEAYVYGWVDILLISSTRPTFLFGHMFPSGQWFFLPAIFLIKTTLTLLVLLLLVPFARIAGHRREFVFLTVPVALYLLAAIFSLINMGVRYLLPIYPFCIVLASAAAASLFTRTVFGRVVVAALMILTVISSLHSYPDFLAYSNELAGGPAHTYRLVTDSNADWGQGLKWTKSYLDQHPDHDCWFDYYGSPLVNPAYYGIHCKPLLTGFGHLIGFGSAPIPSTLTGTVLISSTESDGLLWGPDTLNPYKIFRERVPDATIGNIILVYRGTFNVPLLAAETNATAAIQLLRQHRLPEALALAQAAAQQAPDAADVHAVLGQILLASGHVPEGRQALATALHLAESNHPEFQKYLITQLQHPVNHP